MFVSWRELRRDPKRFALVGGVVALIATLATILSGLAHGLVSDGISGLRAMPVTHLAFEQGSHATFSRSTLDASQLKPWIRERGVQATPIGLTFLNATTGRGSKIDVALVGVSTDSFAAHLPGADHRGLADGIILDASTETQDGIELGDTMQLGASGPELRVAGFADSGSYGHVPIAYVSLEHWQQVVYGNDARGRFSAIAVRTTDPSAAERVARATGTELLTKKAAYAGSPGYAPETLTMTMIRGFLLVICALIVGAFFTILTIQRASQIAVMKAMGASNGFLLRDGIGQVALLVSIAGIVGAGLGAAVVAALSTTDAPVSLSASATVQTVIGLVVVSVLGSAVALRRTGAVEPASALAAREI
jgi:putative ABC transport system permease protein